MPTQQNLDTPIVLKERARQVYQLLAATQSVLPNHSGENSVLYMTHDISSIEKFSQPHLALGAYALKLCDLYTA